MAKVWPLARRCLATCSSSRHLADSKPQTIAMLFPPKWLHRHRWLGPVVAVTQTAMIDACGTNLLYSKLHFFIRNPLTAVPLDTFWYLLGPLGTSR